MKRMGEMLDKITIGHIAITVIGANVAVWLIEHDIVFWMTVITLIVSSLLALRKLVLTIIKDVKEIIRRCCK